MDGPVTSWVVKRSTANELGGAQTGDTQVISPSAGRQGPGEWGAYVSELGLDAAARIPFVGTVGKAIRAVGVLDDASDLGTASRAIDSMSGHSAADRSDMGRLVRAFSGAADRHEWPTQFGQNAQDPDPLEHRASLAQGERPAPPAEGVDDATRARRPVEPAAAAAPLPAGFAPSLENGRDLRDPEHVGHHAYREVHYRVEMFEALNRLPHGEHTDRLAAATLQLATEKNIAYNRIFFEKDPQTGRTQLIDRSDWAQCSTRSPRYDLDLRAMSAQPIEISSQRTNEALSKHYAQAAAPIQERPREHAQALAGLGFDDQVLFARIRRDLPGHVSDEHVAQAMTAAKSDGISDATRVGRVMMLGDRIAIESSHPADVRVTVDLNQPAPKLDASIAAVNAATQQQAQELALQQQQQPGREGLRMA